MTKRLLQILEDGRWMDVDTRARTIKGMVRVYKTLCRNSPNGAPYGMRIVDVKFEHLGRFNGTDWETLARQRR